MSEHQAPKPPRPAHQSSTALSLSHQTAANSPSNPSAAIADQRLQSQNQQSQIQMMQQSSPAPSISAPVSAPTNMENKTGLPDTLKQGIEHLSGLSMDDVKVHYNAKQPAQLQAHAYAQGSNIHLGPGQEKHLPHEAWHVVQQKQGRVPATAQLKSRTYINDDSELEQEADKMGAKAAQMGHALHPNASQSAHHRYSKWQ